MQGYCRLPLVAALFLAGTPLWAESDAVETEPAGSAEAAESAGSPSPAWAAVQRAMQPGPTRITLRDQAQLEMPGGYAWVPREEASQLMRESGNTPDERLYGMVLPLGEDENWWVTVEFEDAGYIKDDDARDWDADELLQSLKDGTESANEYRESVGASAIQVTRWIQSPQYDATSHKLVWSAEAVLKKGEDPDPTINFNTYVLGRDGYLSMNLITSASQVDSDKRAARRLLDGLEFIPGKRYADFDPKTDKVAAYGLAALVAGAAAKKLGLLAVIAAFFAKFFKLILVGLAVAGGWITRIFKGRKADAADSGQS
ncbi:MAG: DUF2167 domain-containing protein [Steroidobacteraceae bacterium]